MCCVVSFKQTGYYCAVLLVLNRPPPSIPPGNMGRGASPFIPPKAQRQAVQAPPTHIQKNVGPEVKLDMSYLKVNNKVVIYFKIL